MWIPFAEEIQEKINHDTELVGLSWFKWSSGTKFTYYVGCKQRWTSNNIYSLERVIFTEDEYACGFEIDDKYLKLTSFKELGIPLKGQGYAMGLSFRKDGLYYDFVYESEYLAHIYVKMSPEGKFDGKIIVPPTWNLDKRQKILLSRSKNVNVVCLDIMEGAA